MKRQCGIFVKGVLGVVCVTVLAGCASGMQGNVGNMAVYVFPAVEAEWIRNGEPIQFEGELWYPEDNIDLLVDSEVSPAGEYRGVQVFIAKVDVRPYDQLYTKFGKNKFRLFYKRSND